MSAIVQELNNTREMFQDVGTIVKVQDDIFIVRNSSGQFRAKRTVSCLVEPEMDDEVLITGTQEGDIYILSVLERPEAKLTRLCVPGNLMVQLKDGKFLVAAAEGVNLVTPKEISTTSGELTLHASEGNVFFEHLSYLGKKAVAELHQVKTTIGFFDSVLERLSQRVKRAYRVVEEFDQLRAEQIDYAAKKNLRLRGKNALVTAKALVKVDGDQIHLG